MQGKTKKIKFISYCIRKTKLFMKKLIYIFSIVAFALTSCEKNEVAKKEISHATQQKIENIVSIVNVNNNLITSLNTAIIDQRQKAPAGDGTEIIDSETEEALNDFVENPQEVLEKIALEENGQEKIDLIESVFLQESQEVIIEKLSKIVPADSIEALNAQIAELNSSFGIDYPNEDQVLNIKSNYMSISSLQKSAPLDFSQFDTKLHFMAGAAAAMTVATISYMVFKWAVFTPWLRVAAIAAAGIGAACFFGAAKELYDYVSNQNAIANGNLPTHGVEWGDFWNTVLGGVAGSAVTVAVLTVIKEPVIAAVVVGVGVVAVGYCPAVYLIWNKKVC
jgi:hypothetical protein